MTKTEFLEELKEAMHRDEDLNEDMLLDDIDEWDSLTFVSVMVLYKNLFALKITAEDLKNCQKVSDLIDLAKLD